MAVSMTGHDRIATISSLKPGDVVPSGRCPKCSGLVYPDRLFEEKLTCWERLEGEEDAPDDLWTIAAHREDWGYYLQIRHPQDHGVEIHLEITNSIPSLTVHTFENEAERISTEPLASMKIGYRNISIAPSQGRTYAVVKSDNVERMTDSGSDWYNISDFK